MIVHFLISPNDVRCCVSLWVADVQARPRWVGEHIEDIVFGFGYVEILITRIWCAKGLMIVPVLLPLGFELVEWERFSLVGHGVKSLG